MKKTLFILLVFAAVIFYDCTKENLQQEKPVTPPQKNELVTAGNKYSVSVNFKSKLKISSSQWWYKDKGSFLVTLDGSTGGTVSKIKNNDSKVTFIKNTGTCDVELVSANQGNVEIASSSNVVAFSGQVYVTFDTVTTTTPKFSVNCDGETTYRGGASGPGAPEYVQFLDNGQKQVMSSPSFTITITPVQ